MSRPFRLAQTVFTRKHWDRWLERLNTREINPELIEGVALMRQLLQARCITARKRR